MPLTGGHLALCYSPWQQERWGHLISVCEGTDYFCFKCICFSLCSFRCLQKWTTVACWRRSEISLTRCPRPSALLWAYCSPRSVSSAPFTMSRLRYWHAYLFISLPMQLLCKNPVNRLRNLESFKMQAFFRGTSFDPYILQKTPAEFILELRTHPDWAATSTRGFSLDFFDNFDCDQIFH